MNILALLAQRGRIADKDIPLIEEEASRGESSIESVLGKRGISQQDILDAKGKYFNVPTKLIGDMEIPFEILHYVPEESATYYHFVPLGVVDGVLEVGITDPDNIEAFDALNFIAQKENIPFKVYLVTETDFERVLARYKGMEGEVGRAISELQTEIVPGKSDEEENRESAHLSQDEIKEEAPITKIVATILRDAIEGRASDIHIEPTNEHVRVRFRLDGILHTSLTLPSNVQRPVVARIKILSSMKLDEKRKPQDGRFSATIDARRVDFRVSTFPSSHGEKVVMRILDKDKGTITLDSLGFNTEQKEILKRALNLPYGLILLTGPTGSGKSTTLYAMLGELDREKHNVISLEDPVEYDIEGVAQSQIRPEIGYTFASGLRSILRQDPDIIMVGEIRDKETAQLAIQAALTGHLVFSTIHTNTAIGVIPRLIDMGVDPFLIAPTLALAVGQRLVRRICPDSGKKIPVEGSIKMMIDKQFEDLPEKFKKNIPWSDHLLGIEPTGDCPAGVRGRVGVYEFLEMNRDLEEAILKGTNEAEIWKLARNKGMLTLREDAIIKAFKGDIPFEEVNGLGGTLNDEDEETPAAETPDAEGGEKAEEESKPAVKAVPAV
jgi:type IV pilus assembly protein PilB